MTTKQKIINVLCFLVIAIIAIWELDIGEIQTTESGTRDFIFNVIGVKIPKEEDLRLLEGEFEELLDYLERNEVAKDEIAALYDQVINAIVCSIANRNFNTLEEQYIDYLERIVEIQESIQEMEEKYQEYKRLLDAIPKFSKALREQKYQEFETIIEPLYAKVCQEKESYLVDKEEIQLMYQNAKKIADNFFYEYYELMCHIVNAEAGGLMCTTMERYYVANVIENRIKSSRFPNTLREVIYAPRQYAPVMSGSIHKEPYSWVREEMENYLRGRIETGMPDNVVYQALFPQGSETWKYIPRSGHYFCCL